MTSTAILPTVRSIAVSPDGTSLAVVIDEREGGTRRSVLDVVPLADSRSSRRLVTGRIGSPTWHPDASRIGFVGVPATGSTAGDTPEVWSVSLDGTLDQWTDVPTGVADFDWSPDGDRLVFSAMTDRERHAGLDRGRTYVTERYPNKLPGLGRVEAVGRALFVADETGDVTGLSDTTATGYGAPTTGLSPSWGDGRIAFLTDSEGVTDAERPETLLSRDVMTVPEPSADGSPTRLTDGDLTASAPLWGPDGQRLTFVAGNPVRPHEPTDLYLVGDERRVLTASLDNRVTAAGATWLDAERLLVPVADAGRVVLAECPIAGEPSLVDDIRADATVQGIDTGGDSIAVCLSSSADGMSVLAGSTCRPVTESLSPVANPLASFARRRDRSRPERIRWTSGEFTVEGWFFPPDATAPYPVVTVVHGGPIDFSAPGFDPTIEHLRDAGFAVFAPNYRGSVSYGERFARAGATDWNGRAIEDIRSGVSELVSLGVADPDRQFLLGRSHGGTVVALAVARSDRFAAAVSEHAVYDFRAAFGGTDATPRLEQVLGLPWEDSEQYEHVSPITHVEEIDTPVLVGTGERDGHAPPWQAEAFYTRLRRRDVPSRLLIYPDSGHGVSDPDVACRRLRELTNWFRKHDPAYNSEKDECQHAPSD